MDEGMSYFDGDDLGFEMASACEDCEVNPATVHLTHVEQGGAHTFHLCEECARRRGVPLPDGDAILRGLQAVLGNAILGAGAPQLKAPVRQSPRKTRTEPSEATTVDTECENCATKLSEFRANGRLGCVRCYGSFDGEIEKILLRFHETIKHKGKKYVEIASRGDGGRELPQLRRELDEAICSERFEDAVAIRDAIRELKQGGK